MHGPVTPSPLGPQPSPSPVVVFAPQLGLDLEPDATRAWLADELDAAIACAADSRLDGPLAALRARAATPWGVAHARFDGGFYEPDAAAGESAIIVAAEEAGDLIDLVAVRARDRAFCTRLGVAEALGLDAVENAKALDCPVLLYRDPLHWLHGRLEGLCILDWSQARNILTDVPSVICADSRLAARVHDAFNQPPPMPRLYAFGEARRG